MNILYTILKPILTISKFDKSQTITAGQSFNNINTVPVLLSQEPIQHLVATGIVTSDTETNVPFTNVETGVNGITMIEKHSVGSLISSTIRINITVFNTPLTLIAYESYDYGATWLMITSVSYNVAGINTFTTNTISNLTKITVKNTTALTGLTNTLSIYGGI